ncbi:EVE domain-containing protein [Aquabacter spiritensis]|uniref:Putative RNA-binding protein with PUA-like domain n=1 Tax=Aquabacter spiritensis TaxID=933073 RepID=A0A4R3LZ20_9HYPH|nr:EVE domain-containing protein [Aquabacter spiritensis]TCT05922.1 putative RNA-binding protein with PUA-like domain [Aquabacter spiritensis]
MAHWLYKSEPEKWSWDQQVAAGAGGTHWDGVRNHSAKLNLMAMKVGEQGFFYHSNEGKEIVGLVEVIRTAYPDPSDPSGKFVMVDLKAVRPLKTPVTLETIKGDPRLSEMALVKFSRLSVQPVTDAEWEMILAYGAM